MQILILHANDKGRIKHVYVDTTSGNRGTYDTNWPSLGNGPPRRYKFEYILICIADPNLF